jgi:HK97 gp10 family phage protein
MASRVDTGELRRLIRELKQIGSEGVRQTAFAVEAEAKMRAPVDTGALRASIHSEEEGPVTWIVADGVEYGIHQELGTWKMAAQPFMVPALEAVAGDEYKVSLNWRAAFEKRGYSAL